MIKSISNNSDLISVFSAAEKKYKIEIRNDIKQFLLLNSGGKPQKTSIIVNDEEYVLRKFLSLNPTSEYYYIEKPMDSFLNDTKGRIIPIGVDSSDNYYCVNNEDGKVYFWSAEEDSYYFLSKNLDSFTKLF